MTERTASSSAESAVTNALSIDVEGFSESNQQSFAIPDSDPSRRGQNLEIERNVDAILEFLDEERVRATFFFLGRIARDLPQVVRRTAANGHEIGSHSYDHLRIFGLERSRFSQDLLRSKAELEEAAQAPVHGFRAPDFSITNASLWALDELASRGFLYDSSIFPIRGHDVYGIAGALATVYRHENGLVEFPPATVSLLGQRVPFAGGGYLRLYPISLTGWMLRRLNRQSVPVMVYTHPYEVGPVIPSIKGLSRNRRFRHYHGHSTGVKRLRYLIRRAPFTTAFDVLQDRGWFKER